MVNVFCKEGLVIFVHEQGALKKRQRCDTFACVVDYTPRRAHGLDEVGAGRCEGA